MKKDQTKPRKKKNKKGAGRKKIADPKILIQLCVEGSKIVGKENLPYNKELHSDKLQEFKEMLLETINFARP